MVNMIFLEWFVTWVILVSVVQKMLAVLWMFVFEGFLKLEIFCLEKSFSILLIFSSYRKWFWKDFHSNLNQNFLFNLWIFFLSVIMFCLFSIMFYANTFQSQFLLVDFHFMNKALVTGILLVGSLRSELNFRESGISISHMLWISSFLKNL